MSFLRKALDRIRADSSQGVAARSQPMVVVGTGDTGKGGDYAINVVGEASYQRELIKVSGSRTKDGSLSSFTKSADLVAEPTNPHDRNAVAVRIDGLTVGYLSRADAVQFHEVMERLGQKGAGLTGLRAFVMGGEFYGVTLYTSHPIGSAIGSAREPAKSRESQEREPEPPVFNGAGVQLVRVNIVGEGSCQDALQSLVPVSRRDARASEWVSATLVCAEEGAVHVRVKSALVGWFEPAQAKRFRAFMSERGAPDEVIMAEVRGGRRLDGRPALYGLALYMEPELAERLNPKHRSRG